MNETVRVAAVGDLHFTAEGIPDLAADLARATQDTRVLLLAGDLTNTGAPEEATALAQALRSLRVPVVAVLGNHDHESDRADDVRTILADANVHVLEGDAVEIDGIGVAGTKGFAGGFGRHALGAWGETAIKEFVREAVNESLALERALAKLRTPIRLALLHYAPIADTVAGEPERIYPFLGSSRLEEPIDQMEVTMAFHGHAHFGSPEGRTRGGVPVFNVSLPLLRSRGYEPPVRIVELPVAVTSVGR